MRWLSGRPSERRMPLLLVVSLEILLESAGRSNSVSTSRSLYLHFARGMSEHGGHVKAKGRNQKREHASILAFVQSPHCSMGTDRFALNQWKALLSAKCRANVRAKSNKSDIRSQGMTSISPNHFDRSNCASRGAVVRSVS
jgi:hypothetical protein